MGRLPANIKTDKAHKYHLYNVIGFNNTSWIAKDNYFPLGHNYQKECASIQDKFRLDIGWHLSDVKPFVDTTHQFDFQTINIFYSKFKKIKYIDITTQATTDKQSNTFKVTLRKYIQTAS